MVDRPVGLRLRLGVARPRAVAAGAVVPDAPDVPGLIHRPDGTVPYTPPIPLYLALCRLTNTTPTWSRPVSA